MRRMLVTSFVAAIVLIAASVTNAAVTPVADYTFDDASSLAPFTLTGTPTVSGGQLQLDGSSYIEIADPLGGATSGYIVEAIVTAGAFNTFDFVLARNNPGGAFGGNNGQGILMQNFGGGTGQLHALNSNSGFATSAVQLPVGVPTALAVVVDGGTTTLYVDGAPVASTAAGIVDIPSNLGIGTHPFDGVAGAFNGSIDRVRLSTFQTFDPNDLIEVPEPASLALLGLGALAMVRRRRTA